MAQNEKEQNDYRITYYNAVSSKEVDWLWYPYIPYGKITILQGDPGEGKSTMMMQLAALGRCTWLGIASGGIETTLNEGITPYWYGCRLR